MIQIAPECNELLGFVMAVEKTELKAPVTNWADLQELIKSRYPFMSKRLQQVAVHVLENPNQVAFETVAVIADELDVVPSTLIRFASALELSGFNQLKNIARQNILEHTVNYRNRIRLMREEHSWHGDQILPQFARTNREALRHLEEVIADSDIRKAVEMLCEAKHVFLLGNGRAHTVATYLHYALNHVDLKAFLVSGTGGMFREQISNVELGDVVLAVSYSPYSSDTSKLAAEAAERGVSVLSITDSSVAPLASISKLAFVVHEARVNAFRSLSASLVLAQALVIAVAAKSQPELTASFD